MKKKKNDDSVILSCVGTSKTQVTGSCWSLSYLGNDLKRHLLMIECGLPQGDNTILESYNSMKRMYNEVKGGGLIQSCENLLFLHGH